MEWDASDPPVLDIGEVFHGIPGVGRFWREWLAAWETVQFEYELVPAGNRVVALIDQWMRGRTTGIEMPIGKYAQIYTFRDGKVVHWRLYMSQAEALEAAGLAERQRGLLEADDGGRTRDRHTYASIMLAAGVNGKTLSTHMGHASIATRQTACDVP